MDPVVLGLSAGTSVACFGLLSAWFASRASAARVQSQELDRQLVTTRRELAQAQAELKAAVTDRGYYRRRADDMRADLERTSQERDAFRTVAETHEVVWPKHHPSGESYREAVWEGRRYADHPSINLHVLGQDLLPYADREVALRVSVEPLGGWQQRTRSLGPMEWIGSGARVLSEFTTWLMDVDLRLMEQRKGERVWADDDSPLVFEVQLDAIHREAPEVHVHTVEVLKTQTQVHERFVEQPVIIKVPIDPDQRLDGLTREEVLALFEVELETKLADFGLRRAAETPALAIEPPPTGETAEQRAQRIARGIHLERQG